MIYALQKVLIWNYADLLTTLERLNYFYHANMINNKQSFIKTFDQMELYFKFCKSWIFKSIFFIIKKSRIKSLNLVIWFCMVLYFYTAFIACVVNNVYIQYIVRTIRNIFVLNVIKNNFVCFTGQPNFWICLLIKVPQPHPSKNLHGCWITKFVVIF